MEDEDRAYLKINQITARDLLVAEAHHLRLQAAQIEVLLAALPATLPIEADNALRDIIFTNIRNRKDYIHGR